ncbi:uncharacterized protein LOC123547320 [Mercenaria mercenaria]|uniref:uncharacterized protein LOC123547320 n=1 Tax=Mercenaria mercenaria TaxID=6596 RepID=UPI00234F5E84|nr:uncharacterized protein LOC123547320 [Mercenaria mercenaria]XP_045190252.2 uncharacterized protein LOC123547320 [Mercenaria mercenaria]XP_045190255.2 uncharacterized protein LOC123547320 [Mercenaria mercenaria]
MSVSNLLSCEPCKYRGLTSSAVKYCKSCQEQLCKECVDFHKSFKVTRDHLLVNTEDQQSLKLCLDVENLRMCKEHLNKQSEFYCLTHDALLCSLCLLKSEQHRNCISEIVEIECVGKSLIDSKFTDMARGEFRNMIVSARHIVNEMKEAKDTTSKSVEAIKSEADALRRKVIEVLDRQIQKIVKKAKKVNEKNNDKYAKTIENMEKIIKEAEDNEKISETILVSGTPADVFRCLISALQQMKDYKIEIDQHGTSNYKQEIIMEKSDLIKQLETHEKPLIGFHVNSSKIRSCPAFPNEGINDDLKTQFAALLNENRHNVVTGDVKQKGKVNMEGAPSDIREHTFTTERELQTMTEQCKQKTAELDNKSSPMSDILRNSSDEATERRKSNTKELTKCQQDIVANCELELKHSYSFNVSSPDSKVPWFGGIAILPNERLLLSDLNNSRLILLDDDNQVLLTKSLKYEPGNISLINTNCLAICLMKTNQILLIDISKQELREKKHLQTKYHPKCIQPAAGKMLVSSQDGNGEWNLDLMTIEGKICRKIEHRMFDGYRIAVQTLSGVTEDFRIVQYCEITNNLQCFGSDDSFVFDYGVERGTSVVTDSNGYIFVIRYTGEVQVLSPNGQYLLKLHSKTMSKSKFAAFNQTMDKLFITTYKEPKIHVLTVKRTVIL